MTINAGCMQEEIEKQEYEVLEQQGGLQAMAVFVFSFSLVTSINKVWWWSYSWDTVWSQVWACCYHTAMIFSGVGSLPGPDILRYLVMDITTAMRYAVIDLFPNKADITTVQR